MGAEKKYTLHTLPTTGILKNEIAMSWELISF